MYVIGVDPGGTTGVAVIKTQRVSEGRDRWIRDGMELMQTLQLEGEENAQLDVLFRIIKKCKRRAGRMGDGVVDVVTERFTLRSSVRSRELLSPERMNAVLQYRLSWVEEPVGASPAELAEWEMSAAYKMEGVGLHLQDPSLAKARWTDDRLRDIKWWKTLKQGGGPHAMDALRHALTFVDRKKVGS